MRKVKKNAYYEINYPMSIYQKQAHVAAMNRTIKDYKENRGWKITQRQIMDLLSVMHIYIIYLASTMYKRKGRKVKSVSKIKIGYFRTIYPVLFIRMRDSGEFTKEEFNIIRNELYKEGFDTYYRIVKQQKEWNQKQKRKLQDNTSPRKVEWS